MLWRGGARGWSAAAQAWASCRRWRPSLAGSVGLAPGSVGWRWLQGDGGGAVGWLDIPLLAAGSCCSARGRWIWTPDASVRRGVGSSLWWLTSGWAMGGGGAAMALFVGWCSGCVAAAKKKRKMTDLNELPPDLNEIPHDVDQQQPSIPPGANADYETENGRSVYYTQITRVPNPIGHDNVAGQSSTRGAPVAVSLQSENHTLNDTSTAANVPCPIRTELGAGVVDGVVQGEEREDEVGSQPMEPYTGMRFGSL